MVSERIQRQLDEFLDDAATAFADGDFARVRELCDRVLRLDPENTDARAYLEAADRDTGVATDGDAAHAAAPSASAPAPSHPDSFAGGRYRVERFLGEGEEARLPRA